MTRLSAILISLVLTSCTAARTANVESVALGTEISLAPGQAVAVKATDITVRFVTVIEDSRCPRDVTCVWAGEVKVQLEVRQSAQSASKVVVRAGDSTMAGSHRISLVRVEPQPASTASIAPQDYRATLAID